MLENSVFRKYIQRHSKTRLYKRNEDASSDRKEFSEEGSPGVESGEELEESSEDENEEVSKSEREDSSEEEFYKSEQEESEQNANANHH